MIRVLNRVITNLKIHTKCENIQSEPNRKSPKFPTIGVQEKDGSERFLDLENTENGINSMIQIDTYSQLSLQEAIELMDLCCEAMRMMGYIRVVGPMQINNEIDKSIHRQVARFNRLVGSLEEIPRFNIINEFVIGMSVIGGNDIIS